MIKEIKAIKRKKIKEIRAKVIKSLLKKGWQGEDIARVFNVHHSQVSRLKKII